MKKTALKTETPKNRPKRRKNLYGLGLICLLGFWFWRCLPQPLFSDPCSTVIEDRDGILLSAKIASDGQWRFPHNSRVPEKFRKAIIQFEDRRFEAHPGVDVLSVLRAAWQNLSQARVVSGASTLTMQTIRLSRKGKPRTYCEKAVEAVLAVRLELARSKSEILALYSSNAPFGGNVVGLDAAAWRYFGRDPQRLSWAEIVTLAVLPNHPSLVHPGRNRHVLLDKRNRLLAALHNEGVLNATDYQLARAEPLPDKPLPLPSLAPHLLARVDREARGRRGLRLRTTLRAATQQKTNRILSKYHHLLVENGVHNGAALVLHNQTGNVWAYVGNVGDRAPGQHGAAVDVIPAFRSTGSVLKPFLYAAMLQDGRILPETLLKDVPTHYGSYSPKNFTKNYAGAVPAHLALARSLNVPAVRMLRRYGTPRFHGLLREMGLTGLERPASHYGLALILGGAEGSLWDIAGMYAAMARTLNHFEEFGARYLPGDFHGPNYDLAGTPAVDRQNLIRQAPLLRAGAIWHCFNALTQVDRPDAQGLWRFFSSSRPVAWKTGTSFGFRDAWAVGCNPEFTVAVWIGNADGEGRPGLTGATTAAPVMFEIFQSLPTGRTWFTEPRADMAVLDVCPKSGYRAGRYCDQREPSRVVKAGLRTKPCPFHQPVFLNASASRQVHGDCYSPEAMLRRNWFILPPAMAWYYRRANGSYQHPPPFSAACAEALDPEAVMELVYPREPTKIVVPVELDGSLGTAVFEAAHRHRDKTVFWHLDDTYLGETVHFHQMAIHPEPGVHQLVLVDEDGRRLEQRFEILPRRSGTPP